MGEQAHLPPDKLRNIAALDASGRDHLNQCIRCRVEARLLAKAHLPVSEAGPPPAAAASLHQTVSMIRETIVSIGAADPDPLEEAPAPYLGNYALERPVGRGGMGVVWRARHVEDQTLAAVKVVRVPHPAMVASIRREIYALSRLDHPGVVKVLDEGVQDGLPWYAMSYVEGVRLSALLCGRHEALATMEPSNQGQHLASSAALLADEVPRLTDGEAFEQGEARSLPSLLHIFRALCDALAYLHGEGMVHRDLKPDNILVRPDGHPVIVDFGLVHRTHTDSYREVLQAPSGAMGTVQWMAPEQARGEQIDARTDLYAVGCMLYTAVTGQPPFLGLTPAVLLRQHQYESPTPPSWLVDDLDPRLEVVITRLLAKERNRRIGYAADVAAVLAEIDAHAPRWHAPTPRAYVYKPKFVGREGDLYWLDQRLFGDGPDPTTASLVLLVGRSGVGKTRLAVEATRRASQRGCTILTGACREGGRPLQGLLGPLQAIVDRCRDDEDMHEQVLGEREAELAPWLPLEATSATPQKASGPGSLEAARARLFRALAATLSAFAEEHPTLVVLDDLQWVDPLLAGFLHSPAFKESGVPVLATFRTDTPASSLHIQLWPEAQARVIGPLDELQVAGIAHQMLAQPVPDSLVSMMHKMSGGNPLFCAEWLRSAVGSGMLRRDTMGHWQLTDDLDLSGLPVPETVRDALQGHLAALSGDARLLCLVAAVLGRPAHPDILQAIAGLDEDRFLAATLVASRQDVLMEGERGRWSFTHDQLRAVTYDAIPPPQRQQTHRRAAEVIEGLDDQQQKGRLAELARHWEFAEERERAVTAYIHAAQAAVRLYAQEQAESLYTSALRLAAGAPSIESVNARIELSSDVYLWTGHPKKASHVLKIALEEARRLVAADPNEASITVLGRATQHHGLQLNATGKHTEAREQLTESLSLYRRLGQTRQEGRVMSNLASTWYRQGDWDQALRVYEQALVLQTEANDDLVRTRTLNNMALVYEIQGHKTDSVRLQEEALDLCRQLGDRHYEGVIISNLANIRWHLGDSETGLKLYREGIAIHREVGQRRSEGYALSNLGSALCHIGRHDDAEPIFQQAIRINEQVGNVRLLSLNHAELGGIAVTRGEMGKAVESFDTAVRLAQSDSYILSLVLLERARCRRLNHDTDGAQSDLDAVENLSPQNPSPEVRCGWLCEHGQLALDRNERADDLLAAAVALCPTPTSLNRPARQALASLRERIEQGAVD